MSTATITEPKTCVYCGTKEQAKERHSYSYGRRVHTYNSSNFGHCSAKGLDCCNKCWSLKYPSNRIPSTSISASGITHEHSLMKCGHSFADSKPLRFKYPKLALPNLFPSQGANSMTVSELDLGSMSAEQAVETLHENADKLNGEESKDQTELLVEKLANLAEENGVNVSAIKPADDSRFTEEECKLFTAAVQERAERLHAELIQATLEKHRAKYKDDPCPVLPKREDGYWLDTSFVTPDVPEQGPYPNRKEADEARQVNIKMFKREQKEKHPVNGNRKTTSQKAAEMVEDNPSESENAVSTKKKAKSEAKKKSAPNGKKSSPVSKAASPKAGAAKAAKPKSEKKPKAAKVPKEPKAPKVKKPKVQKEKKDKPLSCTGAAIQVLQAVKPKALTVPEILEAMISKKLWSPGGGSRGEAKTPVSTVNAKLCLEISGKGKDSRVKRTGHGTYAAT